MSEALERSKARDAEGLFEAWLERRERGSAEPFEALRADHAANARELDGLHESW
ncbi:MAG: hypothetical protein RL112_2962, partial [Planctomycetota bacterium]